MTDATLLNDVKNYLDITWTDDRTDQKLSGIIERGMSAIRGRIGECDFASETQERALLFDYARYARAGEIPAFFEHYKAEILSLQLSRRVDREHEEDD